MDFLLDSNIFIEAKNRYYGFDICPGFWDWMDSVCGNTVGSIINVRDELIAGRDELAAWATDRQDAAWFLRVDDASTQSNFVQVANFIAGQQYTQPAVAHFLSKADPWLIAKAMTLGATLITHELPEPGAKKRVPIPNVCTQFGVRCVNTFDALRHFSAAFRL